jgi:2-dehydropantoate 2-reductase
VQAYKYRKLLTNLGNAVQALLGTDAGEEGDEATRRLHRRAVAEGERVLARAGVPLVDLDSWRREVTSHLEVVDVAGVRRGGGSTWQSLARGAGSVEADYLNGEVVLLARLHGGTAPVNEALRRAVVDAARQGRGPGSMRPEPLIRLVDAAEAADRGAPSSQDPQTPGG